MKLLAAALAALTATIVERTEGHQATGATRYQGEKFMRARLVYIE